MQPAGLGNNRILTNYAKKSPGHYMQIIVLNVKVGVEMQILKRLKNEVYLLIYI